MWRNEVTGEIFETSKEVMYSVIKKFYEYSDESYQNLSNDDKMCIFDILSSKEQEENGALRIERTNDGWVFEFYD